MHAAPPARDCHIPLLRIRRRLDGGIGKEDKIHRLALRAVGRDRVAGQELAKTFIQNATVGQFDATIRLNCIDRDQFAIRYGKSNCGNWHRLT